MANTRVSQLISMTAAEVHSADLFLIVDSVSVESKKIQANQLVSYLNASGSLYASHAILADTASYIDPTSIGIINTSSYSLNSSTSSFSNKSITSSYAITASFALNVASTGSNSQSSSYLIYSGFSNGTSSYSLNSSLSNNSNNSSFLIYTGANNGTSSYALTTGQVILAKTASYFSGSVTTSSYSKTSSFSTTSSLSLTSSFLQVNPATASYSLVAKMVGNNIFNNYGVFLSVTQSLNSSSLDILFVSSSTGNYGYTNISARGNIILSFTSSTPTLGIVNLVSKKILTGQETILDSATSSFNVSPVTGSGGNFITGTINMVYSLDGQSLLSDDYLIFVTSSNVSLDTNRKTRFNISSQNDIISVYSTGSLNFDLQPSSSALITFYSTDGGPFTDYLPGLLSTGSNKILKINVDNQSVNAIRYAWKLNNLTDFSCKNNMFLRNMSGMPPTILNLTCSNCSLNSLPPNDYTSLQTLDCSSNNITSLSSLANTITLLYVQQNYYLSSISSLPTSLVNLNCDHTSLLSLPTIPSNAINITASYVSTFTTTSLENITLQLVINGQNNGKLNILGNVTPSATELSYIGTLQGRGWSVLY